MKYVKACVAVCLLNAILATAFSPRAHAGEEVPPGVSRLLAAADVVVVGTTDRSESLWKENGRGDKVIVTRTLVRTRESMKGQVGGAIWIDVEGGMIDGVTLRASGSPDLKAGDLAVLFLRRNADGIFTLHENGRGVLKLDDRDVVRGTTITLDDIRQAASLRVRGDQ